MKNKSYDIELIRKYVAGELGARAAYELERRAQDDPLLSDLIAGMEDAKGEEHDENLLRIQEYTEKRVNRRSGFNVRPFARWMAAAALILLVSVAGFLILVDKKQQQISVRVEGKVPEEKKAIGPLAEGFGLNQEKKPTVSDRSVQASKSEHQALAKPASRRQQPQEEQIVESERNFGERDPKRNGAFAKAHPKQKPDITPGSSFTSSSNQAKVIPVSASRIVSGTVTDETGKETLPGVAVYIKGAETAVVTDANGKFSIQVPEIRDTLGLSYAGYNSRQVNIKSQDSLEISLSPAVHAMNEVVVRGYQKRNREVTTGSSFIVSGKEVQDVPVGNSRLVAGAVVDENNRPLQGVAVYIKGEKSTAVTDVNGKFSIYVLNDLNTMEVSAPGYNKEQINIYNQDSIRIKLKPAGSFK